MKYEEAYYYFAVVLGKKMNRTANYLEGTCWEAFWSEAGDGKTEGFNAFESYKLHQALKDLPWE